MQTVYRLGKQIRRVFSRSQQTISRNPLGSLIVTMLIFLGSWAVARASWKGYLGFSNTTVLQWLELIVVPISLAVGAYYFSESQSRSEQLIAANHDEEVLLQGYMDSMSELVLEKQLRKATGNSEEEKDLRNVARSRTLITLRGLVTPNPDGHNRRRASLLRFLYETKLIDNQDTIVSLEKANFEVAYARKFVLENANLRRADLYRAYLRRANLKNANLAGAYLVRANLRKADLTGANLSEADLRGADLSKAKLQHADLTGATYGEYKKKQTIWPDGFDWKNCGAKLHK